MYFSDIGSWIAIGTAVLFLSPFAARELSGHINRKSTSGKTIRKLPLTNRSGLGVLDNPHLLFSLPRICRD